MRRLYTRIYLHFLGVLLVVAVATTAVFAVGARGAALRDLAERLTRHVASLVGERVGEPVALQDLVTRLGRTLEVDLAVRDLDGRLLAAHGVGLPAPSAREVAEAREGRLVVRRRPVFRGIVAVRAGGEGPVVGTLSAAVRLHSSLAGVSAPLVGLLLVLLVVAVATWPLARRISRPVERLTDAARRLGEGDLGARAAPDGRGRKTPDELTALTGAFNEMADRVERLVRGQKVLLANVSHELRSPLARIRVALELLRGQGEADRRIADLERDLADLDRLVDDLLATARLDATGLPAQLGPVEGRALLAEVADRAAADPLTAGLDLRVESGEPVPFLADEALLRRALWNLVENAAKYGAPPVVLAAARTGDGVVLSVADEGPGIAPGERDRVTEPFYRGETARARGGSAGAGLGLALARRIAEVHGGRLDLAPARREDGREVGWRVSLRLPASP